MDIGLLWHSGQGPEQAVPLAAARYAERFRAQANVCYVHPTALPDGERAVGGVLIKSSSRVLKNHFWIGIEGHDEGQPVRAGL